MKRVFKVTYDMRIPGVGWAANGNPNGWASRNVLVNGDARDAAQKIVRKVYGENHGGKTPTAVNIIKAELIADNVL